MAVKQLHTKLFKDLEAWSRRSDAFSLNDFLRENGVAFEEFERVANSSSIPHENMGRGRVSSMGEPQRRPIYRESSSKSNSSVHQPVGCF